MSVAESLAAWADRIPRFRARLEEIRTLVQKQFLQTSAGVPLAGRLSELTDGLIVEIWEAVLATTDPNLARKLVKATALVAVGGSGRGQIAPYSDYDLLLLHTAQVTDEFREVASRMVRDCWDIGLKLGHSVRTIPDALHMARNESQFATSLIEARAIWGEASLQADLMRRFKRQVVQNRRQQFISDCITARQTERVQYGATTQQLEPDVKRSLGGLRDLHLIRWIGYAEFGEPEFHSLQLQGAFQRDDLYRLLAAQDFLTSIRIDLHLHAGKPNDILTRSEQLRITQRRGIAGTPGLLPVERLMQDYFRHSTAVAEVARHLAERYSQPRLTHRMLRFLMTYRLDDVYHISPTEIDIAHGQRTQALNSLEGVLRLFLSAARHRVRVAPELADFIKLRSQELHGALSLEAAELFLSILKEVGALVVTLRCMYETGVLEMVLPAFRHVRCLLQFNQYHHYTVDEHTFKCIEACESYQENSGALGQAYRAVQHKEILHLALLLHDAGKGYEEDHCEVGRRLCLAAAVRFDLSDHHRDQLVFLVHQHLMMAHLAFRRDLSDEQMLLQFMHNVGSAEVLRMLYVLTAADITGVGPGVWTDWKADLLTELFDRAMQALSGVSYLREATPKMERIRQDITKAIRAECRNDEALCQKTELLVSTLPTHYLLSTPPQRVAADLAIVRQRAPRDIYVESRYEPETGAVEYRVITHESVAEGCFHKISGVLTAKRMEILTAQICTTTTGVVIDNYRVLDADHQGEVPLFRSDDVASTIRRVLQGELTVATLLNSSRRYLSSQQSGPVSNLPLRVVVDQESSDRCTVIDVFAHDRRGLLYTITKTLYESGLSVVLAKISTHFDQVVDVFYVTDEEGKKLTDSQRLLQIRDNLLHCIQAFEKPQTDAGSDASVT